MLALVTVFSLTACGSKTKPAEGVELIELTIPNGEEDTENGWSIKNTRLGVLRPNEDGKGYQVTNFGTGW